MRYLAPIIVLILAQIGAAWAVGDTNIARPGGSFATVEATSPAVCARACADDTLCMAWSFEANSCELKAIVPVAISRDGVISGVSARAPASMRVSAEPPQQIVNEAVIIAHETGAPTPLPSANQQVADASLALLGGPETVEDLRGGLGN